jgi:hypothetical protein
LLHPIREYLLQEKRAAFARCPFFTPGRNGAAGTGAAFLTGAAVAFAALPFSRQTYGRRRAAELRNQNREMLMIRLFSLEEPAGQRISAFQEERLQHAEFC